MLTEEGMKIASDIYKKHEFLVWFFTNVLGIERDIAERDACIIEHGLSKETFTKLVEFIRKVLSKEIPEKF